MSEPTENEKNSFREDLRDTEELRKRYSIQLSSGYFSRSESEEDKEQKSEPEGGSVDTEGLSQSSGYNSSDSNVGKETLQQNVAFQTIYGKGVTGDGDEMVAETTTVEVSETYTISRIKTDGDSEPVQFYAEGPGKRALCVRQGKDVLLMTDTGEDIPNRENKFILVDPQKYCERGISGTQAKLQTEKRRTSVVLYIPDVNQPKRAELRTALNVIANDSSTVLSEAVVHNVAVHEENCPQITIYYPSDTLWYYIVPSLNSNFVTVEPKEPSADLVQKYMHWSYNPFQP